MSEQEHVASIAVFKGNNLLMGKRRDNGRHTLPGGHLDEGETPMDGAKRELMEEAGIDLPKSAFVHLRSEPITTYSGKSKTIHAYKVGVEDDQVHTMQDDPDQEVERWHWIDVEHGLPQDIADNLHSPKNIVLEALGLLDSKIEKGERGDWKKEGYTISHKEKPLQEPHLSEDGYTHELHVHLKDKEGKTAGKVKFLVNKQPHIWVDLADINIKHRRKGLATSAYEYAEKITGKKISKPDDHSEDAQKLWSQPKRPFGKSLEKGEKGDWKKEGYTLQHRQQTPEEYAKLNSGAIGDEKDEDDEGYKQALDHVKKHPEQLDHIITAHHSKHGQVGQARFAYEGGEWGPVDSTVKISHRRKGIASSMYNLAEKKIGGKITTGHTQTGSAKKLWSQPNRPFGKSLLDYSDDIMKDWDGPKKKTLGVGSPKHGHTIHQLKRLKEMGWHNPDTGLEISEEEGEQHLMHLQQRAADKKVDQMIAAQSKIKKAADVLSEMMKAWEGPKAKPGDYGLKQKPFDPSTKAGHSLKVIGSKMEALKQLKVKNPHVNWDEVMERVKKTLGVGHAMDGSLVGGSSV